MTPKDCPHNFKNPKWVGRAHYLCRDCGEDIKRFLSFVFMRLDITRR